MAEESSERASIPPDAPTLITAPFDYSVLIRRVVDENVHGRDDHQLRHAVVSRGVLDRDGEHVVAPVVQRGHLRVTLFPYNNFHTAVQTHRVEGELGRPVASQELYENAAALSVLGSSRGERKGKRNEGSRRGWIWRKHHRVGFHEEEIPLCVFVFGDSTNRNRPERGHQGFGRLVDDPVVAEQGHNDGVVALLGNFVANDGAVEAKNALASHGQLSSHFIQLPTVFVSCSCLSIWRERMQSERSTETE